MHLQNGQNPSQETRLLDYSWKMEQISIIQAFNVACVIHNDIYYAG